MTKPVVTSHTDTMGARIIPIPEVRWKVLGLETRQNALQCLHCFLFI
jgi:hypothetical protein